LRHPPVSTLFPYPTLFRSVIRVLPVIADGIAIFVVPFGPTGRKATHLIAARTNIPRLADQFDLREHRVLPHRVEKAAALVKALRSEEHTSELQSRENLVCR